MSALKDWFAVFAATTIAVLMFSFVVMVHPANAQGGPDCRDDHRCDGYGKGTPEHPCP